MITEYEFDIIIVGAGASGLYLLNRLQTLGFNSILIEKNAIGCQQSIACQGIIHRGIKYTLTSPKTAQMPSLSTMPTVWHDALNNEGSINLSATKILSKHYYLWSNNNWKGQLKTFVASNLLRSHSTRLTGNQCPKILTGHSIYQVDETVVDMPSLLTNLAEPHKQRIFKLDLQNQQLLFYEATIQSIALTAHKCKLRAQHYIFTCGEGNAHLLPSSAGFPAMQCRPLHMVFVKFNAKHTLFAHCFDNYSVPRLTITTHRSKDGSTVWYLGGKIAEQGVTRNTQEQIKTAQQELAHLLPQLVLPQARWGSFYINRAEPKQRQGKRPTHFFVQTKHNYSIAWPTKLTFIPAMAHTIVNTLKNQKLTPKNTSKAEHLPLCRVPYAVPEWERAL